MFCFSLVYLVCCLGWFATELTVTDDPARGLVLGMYWVCYSIALLGFRVTADPSLWRQRLTKAIACGWILFAFITALVRITDCSLAIKGERITPAINEWIFYYLFVAGNPGFFLLLLMSFAPRLWRWWHQKIKNQALMQLRHQEALRLEQGAGVGQAIDLKKMDSPPS